MSKALILVSAFVFVPALCIMNYGSLTSNRGLFFVSFLFALIGAIIGGWAVKVRTGRLALGMVGAAFLYIIAAMIFSFSIVLSA